MEQGKLKIGNPDVEILDTSGANCTFTLPGASRKDNPHLFGNTALDAAFVSAQAEFKSAIKDSANPFFKSKYADLASIWNACSDSLKKHKLAISQAPGRILSDPTRIEITTTLIHVSGQTRAFTMEVPLVKIDAQGLGSCISYGRRYALTSALGIVVEDDDGNAGSKIITRPKRKSEGGHGGGGSPDINYALPLETITKDEAKELAKMAQELGWTNEEKEHLLDEFGLESIMDLEKSQVSLFEAHLRREMRPR